MLIVLVAQCSLQFYRWEVQIYSHGSPCVVEQYPCPCALLLYHVSMLLWRYEVNPDLLKLKTPKITKMKLHVLEEVRVP